MIAVYLLLVLKILPNFIKNRQPCKINFIIRSYNIFQIISCSLIIATWWSLGLKFRFFLKCLNNDDFDMIKLDELAWWFLMLRFCEIFETFFFILRKKFVQVSFLHIYHHISSLIVSYSFLRYNGGATSSLFGTINSFVHILMYFYYFLSSFKKFEKISKILRQFITAIQIIQLLALVGQSVVGIMPNCDHTKFPFVLQGLNLIFLIFLFGKFYVKNFVKRKNK